MRTNAVSDMRVAVKSREIQRGMLAEMRGHREEAGRHFLAAAHLELVLAQDYARDGQPDRAFRSRLSAASCFWRAGAVDEARRLFHALERDAPHRADEIHEVLEELEPWDPTSHEAKR